MNTPTSPTAAQLDLIGQVTRTKPNIHAAVVAILLHQQRTGAVATSHAIPQPSLSRAVARYLRMHQAMLAAYGDEHHRSSRHPPN